MSIPNAFRGLVDDAAVFPPGLMPMAEAVPAHAAHLASARAGFVGPFVVALDRLDEVAAAAPAGGVRVSVVVPSPGRLAETFTRVAGAARLSMAGAEVKLDPAGSAAAGVEAVVEAAPRGSTVYVELPRPGHPEWPLLPGLLARHGLRAKLRTGGTEVAAFPSEDELATWIRDLVTAGVPFKCTAGLHEAVRHTAAASGFEHHGYLNVLLGTLVARAGGGLPEVRAALAERDGAVVAARLAEAGDLAAARESFTSYGSCSILEPLADLVRLGLVPAGVLDGVPA